MQEVALFNKLKLQNIQFGKYLQINYIFTQKNEILVHKMKSHTKEIDDIFINLSTEGFIGQDRVRMREIKYLYLL